MYCPIFAQTLNPYDIQSYAMLILYNLYNVSPVDQPSYVC